MATQYFSFDELAGSDPAGYTSINDLIDSIDITLNTRFGSILNNTNYPPVGATDKVLFWDGSAFGLQKIDNDNVASGAGIAYSKLNLTGSIVSADIVDGTIVNADINAAAAIAYSKLALSSSIQTSDFATGATAPKAADLTGSTVGLVYQQGTDDTTAIANGTNGQILQLTGGAPVWSNVSGLSIDTANIADDAITDAKLRDSVSTDSDRAVTTDHIRNSAVTLAKLAADAIGFLVPVGMISPFAGSSAPSGWLLCHGQAVSQTTYAALFAVIGSTYDVTSPGAGNFRVPDLRGRVIAGIDNMGGSDAGRLSWQNVLGTVGPSSIATDAGTQTHTLTTAEIPSHTHTITDGAGAHTHTTTVGHNVITNNSATGSGNAVTGIPGTTGNTNSNAITSTSAGGHNHTINAEGGGTAHNNMQPTMLLNYIIKV